MDFLISLDNLLQLSKGVGVLGSGGGGDVNELLPLVREGLLRHGAVKLLSLDDISDDDWVATIELIGAPIPYDQRTELNRVNLQHVIEYAIAQSGKDIKAIMPVEIGGSNSLTPLCVAGRLQLPLIDGDLLGRALPEIPMISTNLFDIMPNSAYIADPVGEVVTTLICSSYEELEVKARAQAMTHSTFAAVLIPLMLTGRQVKLACIKGSYSRALEIGCCTSIEELCYSLGATIHIKGVVKERNYAIKKGFLVGNLIISNDAGKNISISVKNEYLEITSDEIPLAKAPDIITLLDDSVQPLLSDQVKVGASVVCISFKGPAIWYTPKGLELINRFFQ